MQTMSKWPVLGWTMRRIYLYNERLLNSKITCLTSLEKLSFFASSSEDYWLQSCGPMRDTARFLVQSATKTKQIKPVNGLASMATPSSKFWLKLELYSPFPECLTFSSHVCSLKNHTGMMTITTPQRHGNEKTSSESVVTKDENVEPLVAFSRPPPLPPVLGPLVVLSFFEMSSGDEDNKWVRQYK